MRGDRRVSCCGGREEPFRAERAAGVPRVLATSVPSVLQPHTGRVTHVLPLVSISSLRILNIFYHSCFSLSSSQIQPHFPTHTTFCSVSLILIVKYKMLPVLSWRVAFHRGFTLKENCLSCLSSHQATNSSFGRGRAWCPPLLSMLGFCLA